MPTFKRPQRHRRLNQLIRRLIRQQCYARKVDRLILQSWIAISLLSILLLGGLGFNWAAIPGHASPTPERLLKATPFPTLAPSASPARLSLEVPHAQTSPQLPPLQTYPMPSPLAEWTDPQHQGDYFDQIQTTRVGYLLWTQFPVRVYVEPSTLTDPQRVQGWQSSAMAAIAAWQIYFPLEATPTLDQANIVLSQVTPNQTSGARARSAQTRFTLSQDAQGRLRHHMTIQIRPTQAGPFETAAIRHELGHALGIWGHSPVATDALYFSQVREPPPISARDVNTLQQIYRQGTRLGGPLS